MKNQIFRKTAKAADLYGISTCGRKVNPIQTHWIIVKSFGELQLSHLKPTIEEINHSRR